MNRAFTAFTDNIICGMAMSTGCSGSDNDAKKIKKMCETSTRLAGKLVIGDILGPFKKIYSSRGS